MDSGSLVIPAEPDPLSTQSAALLSSIRSMADAIHAAAQQQAGDCDASYRDLAASAKKFVRAIKCRTQDRKIQ